MIELFLYSVLYSICVFVPLLTLHAVFMILTERWEVEIEDECDNDFDFFNDDHLPSIFKRQAE